MADTAFVLLRLDEPLPPVAIAASSRSLGVPLTHREAKDGTLVFSVDGGGELFAMTIRGAHPDAAKMERGPFSPTPDQLAEARSHAVLIGAGWEGTPAERELRMLAVASAVASAGDAVAAMLGEGSVFHEASTFIDLTRQGLTGGFPPAELVLDVSYAREPDGGFSYLTHGLRRHGRDELYVRFSADADDALDLLYAMANWLLSSDVELRAGETVGRTPSEKLPVERVPSPTEASGEMVTRLTLR